MTLRLPKVWPSCTSLAVAVVLHAAMVGGIFFVSESKAVLNTWFENSYPMVLIFAAIAHGMRRVRRYHPALYPAYRAWLEQTPWTSEKALPLGPVYLVGADIALLGLAFLAALPFWGVTLSLSVLQAFLVAYMATIFASLLATGEWVAGYGSCFGLTFMALFWRSSAPFFAIAALTYGLGQFGLRRSLARFPWGFKVRTDYELLQQKHRGSADLSRLILGWPFGTLFPRDDYASLSRVHGVISAALSGWSVYVFSTLISPDDPLGPSPLFLLGALYGSLIRLFLYRILDHQPPISLAGRLQTGRLIIPSYDQVFVAPLLSAILVTATGINLLNQRWSGHNPNAIGSTAFGLAMLILLTMGPDRRTWLLTAPTRITSLFGQQWLARLNQDKVWTLPRS